MPAQPPAQRRERRKPRQPIAEDNLQFPHHQPFNRELRAILDNARVTRATPRQAAAALTALKEKLRVNPQYFYQLPKVNERFRVREFIHAGKAYVVKQANVGSDDHGAGMHEYEAFAKAYRQATRKWMTPELVLVKMKAYGTVEANGTKFLLIEKIKGNPIYGDDMLQLSKHLDAINPNCVLQEFHAIVLKRLRDGRPVVMLPHDYA